MTSSSVAAAGVASALPRSVSGMRQTRLSMWTAAKLSLGLLLLLTLNCGWLNLVLAEEEKSEGAAPAEAVVTLTTSNFTRFVETNPVVLVEFYAPWCGHCKRFAPEFEAAAQALKGEAVYLAKVDATDETELASNYGITGYPTLKFFRNGEPEEYRGNRSKASIVSWIHKVTGDPVTVVDNKAAAETAVKDESAAFVGHFVSDSSEEYTIFRGVADKNRNWGKFVAFFSPSGPGAVTVYRKDEGAGVSTTVKDASKLTEFCDQERFPYCGAISGENYNDYFSCGRSMIWFAGTKTQYEEAGPVVKEAAKARRSVNNFVWLDTDEYKDHAESYLGVKEFPALVSQSKEGRYVYPEKEFKDGAAIVKFLEEVDQGKVPKSFLSEKIPEKNDEPVKVVVGNNFEEMVLQSDRDVLLEVYAPWCGHCKKFEPVYESFAKSVQSTFPKLVVAKMDGTANEPPVDGFPVPGFPTVYYVKAGETTPMTFSGDRTVEGLTEFVKEHSSFPVASKDEL